MFKIIYTGAAIKSLEKLPTRQRRRLREKIRAVGADPMGHHPYLAPLKGRPESRIREGEWRALIELDHEQQTLAVLNILHRREAYR